MGHPALTPGLPELSKGWHRALRRKKRNRDSTSNEPPAMDAPFPARENKMSINRSCSKASLLPLRVRLGVMKSVAVPAVVTAFQHRVEIVTPPGIESIFP